MCESRTWDALQTIKLLKSASIYKSYHSISFNSAPSVTHYQLAEILILAGPRFECDIQIYLAGRGKICARSLQIVHCKLNYIYYLHNACKHNRWASVIFFVFLIHFLIFQMVSALNQNLHYLNYILVILSPAWCVTAKLNKILQY